MNLKKYIIKKYFKKKKNLKKYNIIYLRRKLMLIRRISRAIILIKYKY